MICNVQKFSIHDGDGIRTTVFFKGCSLRCGWCANPESQSDEQEVTFDQGKCIGCRDCIKAYPQGKMTEKEGKILLDPSVEQDATDYLDLCPSKAIEVIGEKVSSDQIVKRALADRIFYRQSFGGVTFSGGEPLKQADLAAEAAKKLKQEGIHIAVDTCLSVPWESIELMLPYADEFLADVKHTRAKKFYQYTGGDLAQVNGNLEKLAASGASVRGRVAVIYGFNDTMEEIKDIVDYLAGLKNIHRIDFLPYHPLGENKSVLLGREYHYPKTFMDKQALVPYQQYAEKCGFSVSIGG